MAMRVGTEMSTMRLEQWKRSAGVGEATHACDALMLLCMMAIQGSDTCLLAAMV
jgi:hypothetical protein